MKGERTVGIEMSMKKSIGDITSGLNTVKGAIMMCVKRRKWVGQRSVLFCIFNCRLFSRLC